MRLVVAVVITLTTESGALAQEPVLRGRVVDAGSSAPIAHARVTALLAPQRTGVTRNPVAETDGRGEFALALPSGTTSVRITKATYAVKTLPLPVDQPLEVRLPLGAVITGRVLDPNGAPATGLYLSALPITSAGSLATESSYYSFVDDRGDFRIGGLPEGRYVVKASTEGAEPSVPVTLRPGEQVDLPMGRMPPAQCRLSALVTAPSTGQKRTVIRGQVLNASNTPLACTPVRLGAVGGQLPDPAEFLSRSELQVITDSQGRFEFPSVPEGVYSVYAYMRGYARGREGPIEVPRARADDPRPLVVADVTVRLFPAGVMTGVVSDEAGEPVQASSVVARQVRIVDGHPVGVGTSSVVTDDRGRFRLFGLGSGRWVVSSSGDESPLSSTTSFYYPGTPDSRLAAPIDITGSEIHDGIDIQLMRVGSISVSGVVIDSKGLPLAEGNVMLDASYRSGALKTLSLPTPIIDGRFEFPNVAPGDYVVQVGRNTGQTWEFGRALVNVGDTAPAPLSIHLTEGRSVSGQVRLDDGSVPTALVRIRLAPVDLDEAPAGILVADPVPVGDDEFRAEHVVGVNRFVLVNAPVGWYLKSVRIDGRETVEQPFDFGFASDPIRSVEIVVSPAAASVTGTVRDRDATRRGYTAVVFSTNADDWYSRSARVRFARSTRDGRFNVTGLPPGSYYVAAIAPLDDVTMWQDQVPLDALIGTAERVTLREAETRDALLKSTAP